MLSTMMEKEKKNTASIFFAEIMIVDHSISDYDLRKEIEILVKLLF